RGEPNFTSWPSTFNVPEVCGCSPEMILMRVDLPAPLSPSTQATSPARTVRLMPSSATMGPKALPTSCISTSASPLCRVGSACSSMVSVMSSPPGRRVVADVEVHTDGEQEHHAQEGEEPVRVEPGVDDALLGHAEDERADGRADGRPVATGEQTAADDRGDDVAELVAHTQAGLHRGGVEQQVHAVEPAQEPDAHEQPDLDLGHGYADGAGGGGVAAHGEDPVAGAGAEQDPGGQRGEQQPPQDGDLDVHEAERDVGGEDGLGGGEPVQFGDVVRGDGAGDALGDGQVDAAQGEERGQGDEEAG